MNAIWKMVTGILNHHLTSEIYFYNILHGFCTGRGTGTSSLEVKLLQKLAVMREEIIYGILLYIHKAYEALDHVHCLGITTEYGVDTRALCLLWRYRDHLLMLAMV